MSSCRSSSLTLKDSWEWPISRRDALGSLKETIALTAPITRRISAPEKRLPFDPLDLSRALNAVHIVAWAYKYDSTFICYHTNQHYYYYLPTLNLRTPHFLLPFRGIHAPCIHRWFTCTLHTLPTAYGFDGVHIIASRICISYHITQSEERGYGLSVAFQFRSLSLHRWLSDLFLFFSNSRSRSTLHDHKLHQFKTRIRLTIDLTWLVTN